MGNYELYLSTDRGVRLKLLDQAGGFTYAHVANDIGAFSIIQPGDFDRGLLRVDRQRHQTRLEYHASTQHPALPFFPDGVY